MIIGIDLGTTNSLVALWRDGQARIVPNALGESLTPSVVGLDDDDSVLVGRAARERLLTHPQLTAANFKRYMGSSRSVPLGKRRFRPEELSALVLKSLKADAEAALGEPVTEAVITVPAYFNDAQRKATRVAGELAGLTVERLLNEPTAAALAYGLHQRDVESKFLVFDLGGGTFDVSILELFENVMEVRASAGDNFLGGEDFVDILVQAYVKHTGYGGSGGLPALQGRQLARAREQAERAKRELTERESAVMRIDWEGREYAWEIGRDRFDTLAEPLLERLVTPVERALRDARLRAGELDDIVLVGGATRMPVIRRLVARMFGRLPSGHINPDEVVALGAAVQAGLKARDAALRDVVLTDVCPYTLGTEVARSFARDQHEAGHYLPIIERNTVIPASRVERVQTILDYQREVQVRIFQGEARMVKDNIFLGQIAMKVPAKPAGEESIDIRFTYDINGLLEVEATVVSIGDVQRLVIEQNPGTLSPEQIEERLAALAKLKIHPREQSENRAVLARAERLYEMTLGELRTALGDEIARFESVLAHQNQDEIEPARAALVEILNRLEGESYW